MFHKKIIYIPILILLLVFAVLVVIKSLSQKSAKNNPSKINVQEIDKSKLPEKIPSDIPREDKDVQQNYIAQSESGRKQYTRVFLTSKSLAENYEIYKAFLKQNDWKINSDVNTENFKMISGVKNSSELQIQINQNTENYEKTVNISLTESK